MEPRLASTAVALTSALCASACCANALDPNFGTDGRALMAMAGPAPYFERRSGVVVDALGRVLVYGTSLQGNADQADVRRLTSVGSRDVGFGVAGTATLHLADAGLPSSPQTAVGAGLASDGGYWLAGNGGQSGFLARIDANGGQVPIGPFAPDLAGALNGPVEDLTTDETGRVWIVTLDADVPDVIVIQRRTADGLLDPSFGSGIATVEVARANRRQLRLRTIPGGGAFLFGLVGGAPVAAQRLQENGAVDIAFGQAGSTPLPATDVLPVGDLFYTITQRLVSPESWELRRLTAAGQLDSSVAPQTLSSGDPFSNDVPRLALESEHRILVAGPIAAASGSGNVRNDIGVFRLLADGRIDTAFGNAGLVRIAFADNLGLGRLGGYTNNHVLSVDSADRIVVAGQHFFEDLPPQTPDIGHVAIARLRAEILFGDGFEAP
jgi:uncharacterized delta-60 repeat protein